MRPWREHARTEDMFRADLPAGVLVPAPPPGALARVRAAARLVPSPVRRAARAVAVEVAVFVLVAVALAAVHHTALHLTAPNPPTPVCGNSALLNGPSSPPAGAVTVAAGDNSGENWNQPGTTFWFAAGTHTLGSGPFNAIAPGNNETFLGAPGAVISGQFLNKYAFVGTAAGITIEYLTVEDFATPVNEGAVDHDASKDWTIEYDTLQDNIPGTAVYVGTDSVLDYDCITANGQQGFGTATNNYVNSVTGGASNVQVNYNEISFNNVCNVEGYSPFPITPPSQCGGVSIPGCGCTGGGKFWTTYNSQFVGNYVHDNYNAGVWYDTDNAVSDIENNYFADNLAWGIAYEISYNAKITSNVFVGNGNYLGAEYAPLILPAIFISNSGSDPRLGAYGTTFEISGNQFYDNWDGIQEWQDSDRFCASPNLGYGPPCTIVNPTVANVRTCGLPVANARSGPAGGAGPPGRRTTPRRGSGQGTAAVPLIASPPYYDDCQWKTNNVKAYNNLFDFSPADIPDCTAASDCGYNTLISETGIFFPYAGNVVPDNVTFSQGNLFSGNTYCGPWNFQVHIQGSNAAWDQWTAAPYSQDPSSTINGPACGFSRPPVNPGRLAGPGDHPVPGGAAVVATYITGLTTDSTTGGYWHDQNGNPRFALMDNPWALIVNAGEWNGGNWQADMSSYLSYKQAQGYTACYVAALGCIDIGGSYENGNTWDNVPPFTGGGHPSAGLNSTYWQRVDYLITTAASYGITVFLNIAYTADGTGNGNLDPGGALDSSVLTQAMYTDYGTAVAGRYAASPNLVWVYGNDYYATNDTQFGYIRSAVVATGDTHAMAVHNYPESTSRYDVETSSGGAIGSTFSIDYSQVNWVYTYNVTYFGLGLAYGEAAAHSVSQLPAMWGDGYFVYAGVSIPPEQLMTQMTWWAMASGARGVTSTSNDCWSWGADALANSETENWYAVIAPAIVAAFTGLPGWHRLMPDTSSQLVTSGRGTSSTGITTGSNYLGGTDDYVAAARVADGSLAVIYGAKAYSITINQAKMAAGYTATWVDPFTGARTATTAGSAYNSGGLGNNSAGYPDWALVLQGPAVTAAPPAYYYSMRRFR